MEQVSGSAMKEDGVWKYIWCCPCCGRKYRGRGSNGRCIGSWVLACSGEKVERLTLKEWYGRAAAEEISPKLTKGNLYR